MGALPECAIAVDALVHGNSKWWAFRIADRYAVSVERSNLVPAHMGVTGDPKALATLQETHARDGVRKAHRAGANPKPARMKWQRQAIFAARRSGGRGDRLPCEDFSASQCT